LTNRVVASLALGLGLCLAAGAQTSTPTKVGIINIQAAMVGTREGQIAQKALQERSAPKQKELEKKRSDIENKRNELNRVSNTASEDQKRKLMADIDTSTKAFNRDVEDAQSELDQEQNKVLNELGGKMMQVIEKYARDNGYAVILDVSNPQTPVLFASSQIDVTKDIIELYDKNAPSAAPATTTTAPPAATRPATIPPSAVKPGTVAPKPVAPKPGTVK
jgi:outer membrane protein